MDDKTKNASRWLLLELCAFFLSAEDFQHYCDTYPEEVEQTRKMLLSQECHD